MEQKIKLLQQYTNQSRNNSLEVPSYSFTDFSPIFQDIIDNFLNRLQIFSLKWPVTCYLSVVFIMFRQKNYI